MASKDDMMLAAHATPVPLRVFRPNARSCDVTAPLSLSPSDTGWWEISLDYKIREGLAPFEA